MTQSSLRWKWAIDATSKTLVLFEDGTAFEAEASGDGKWARLGNLATVFSEEGCDWRNHSTLPVALRPAPAPKAT